ncbi:MAG TPA: hypothetical protein VK638_22920 [Edaphobacter sp.]|nr:hypothetical protein [Edaphobacter sp.]
MPLSVLSSPISSSQELSAPDQPKSLGSEHKPEVTHGGTESGAEHVTPDETSSFLAGYSNDQAATPEASNSSTEQVSQNENNPSAEQLSQNEMEMRKAADSSDGRQPDALENHGIKFAFLPSHFEGGVVPGNNEESAKRLASMMPASLSEGGHLERLMLEPDPAHKGSHKVNEDTLFESAAALKYAQQKGYPLNSVGRHSATVDFHATENPENPDKPGEQGKQVLFDPFGSPQMKGPHNTMTTLRKKVSELEEKKNSSQLSPEEEKTLKDSKKNLAKLENTYNKNPYKTTPNQWAKGAYTDHTNESKGTGVTGIWHTTATAGDQMPVLRKAAQSLPKGKVEEVDLNLAAEFTKEDHQARQEMLGRINEGSTRPQRDGGSSVDQEAFKRKATDFLS